MWGRAKTTPRPAARYSNAARICPVSCIPLISRPTGITGSRNASSQYRAYERMACLDSARSSPPGAWLPITRRRLPSSTCTPGPCRRQASPAANLNPRWAHDSGRRHTTDQPRPYPASVSLSLSVGTGHLLKRTLAGPYACRIVWATATPDHRPSPRSGTDTPPSEPPPGPGPGSWRPTPKPCQGPQNTPGEAA